MTGPDPRLLDTIATELRPLLAAAEAQWRDQYRLTRSLPEHWHGDAAAAAVDALFAGLDAAESTLTRIRDAIDTLDAAAAALRVLAARLDSALGGLPEEAAAALREASTLAMGQVVAVVDSILDPGVVLDPGVAEPEALQEDPVVPEPPGVPAAEPPAAEARAGESAILVDPVASRRDLVPPPVTPVADEAVAAEPTLLQANSGRRGLPASHAPAQLAAVGPDDDPTAPILAEAGSW